jgi:hypothetical protein
MTMDNTYIALTEMSMELFVPAAPCGSGRSTAIRVKKSLLGSVWLPLLDHPHGSERPWQLIVFFREKAAFLILDPAEDTGYL